MADITLTTMGGAECVLPARDIHTLVQHDGFTQLTYEDPDTGDTAKLRVRETTDEINAMLRVAYEED